MRKLQVGVICYPSLGGSGVIATELAKKLAARGHTMHFITSQKPFRLEHETEHLKFHEARIDGYAVFQFPPYDIALANKIAHTIVEEKLDLLHVHYAVPHAISAALGKDMAKSTIPIITTLHGTDVTVLGENKTLKDTVRYGIEKSTVATAVSHALKEDTYRMIRPQQEIRTIYNFIDEQTYQQDAVFREKYREQFGLTADMDALIHVSNFRAVKRIDYILRSFAEIVKQGQRQLFLVGEGPELENMQELACELGIQQSVHFLGRRNDVNALLNMSDVMLHLSDKEAFGLAILEGFATGCPVVGTAIGGIPEIVEEGKNGFLVELDEPLAVAAAVEQILHPTHRQTFRQHALETATRFRSEQIVDQYEALYQEVCHED